MYKIFLFLISFLSSCSNLFTQDNFSFFNKEIGTLSKSDFESKIYVFYFVINNNWFEIGSDEGVVAYNFQNNLSCKDIICCKFNNKEENEVTYYAQYDINRDIIILEENYNKYADVKKTDIIRRIRLNEYEDVLLSYNAGNKTTIVENNEKEGLLIGRWKISSPDNNYPEEIKIYSEGNLFNLFLKTNNSTEFISNGLLKKTDFGYVDLNSNEQVKNMIIFINDKLIYNNKTYDNYSLNISSNYTPVGNYFSEDATFYCTVKDDGNKKYNIDFAEMKNGTYTKVYGLKSYNIIDGKVIYYNEGVKSEFIFTPTSITLNSNQKTVSLKKEGVIIVNDGGLLGAETKMPNDDFEQESAATTLKGYISNVPINKNLGIYFDFIDSEGKRYKVICPKEQGTLGKLKNGTKLVLQGNMDDGYFVIQKLAYLQ